MRDIHTVQMDKVIRLLSDACRDECPGELFVNCTYSATPGPTKKKQSTPVGLFQTNAG